MPDGDVTALLRAAGKGDAHAWDVLFDQVYTVLHRQAHYIRRGGAGQTLNTTALVHEAYLKLAGAQGVEWNDRLHFYRVAARAMRQVLVNMAERRNAQKRGGGVYAATLNEHLFSAPVPAEDVLALNEALHRLEALNPRQATVVECRYFAGLTVEETAAALGISSPTVKRDWRMARAWLSHELK